MTRRVAFAVAAMTASQAAVYVVRPMTSYRLLGIGAGARDVGLVTAAFALLPLFAAIPLGRASDRRRIPLVTVGCAVQVVACVALAAAKTPLSIGAASALLGLGHLGVALGVQDVIARESRDADHDRHFGLLTAGVSLGQLLGPLLGGLLLASAASRVSGTTHAMLAAAAIALAATVLAGAGERGAPAVPAARRRAGSVAEIMGTRGVPAGILASVAVLSAADVFTAYMPVLGEERGLGPATVGVLLALRAGASMVSRVGIGAIVHRVGRLRLMTVSAAAAGVALGSIALVHGTILLGVLCFVAGLGLGFGQPLSMTIVVQLVPTTARATALAVRLTGNRLGQVAAPAAAGLIAGRAGAASVFWLTAGTLGASAWATQRPGLRRADSHADAEPEEVE